MDSATLLAEPTPELELLGALFLVWQGREPAYAEPLNVFQLLPAAHRNRHFLELLLRSLGVTAEQQLLESDALYGPPNLLGHRPMKLAAAAVRRLDELQPTAALVPVWQAVCRAVRPPPPYAGSVPGYSPSAHYLQTFCKSWDSRDLASEMRHTGGLGRLARLPRDPLLQVLQLLTPQELGRTCTVSRSWRQFVHAQFGSALIRRRAYLQLLSSRPEPSADGPDPYPDSSWPYLISDEASADSLPSHSLPSKVQLPGDNWLFPIRRRYSGSSF
jgi:hypothetical protein